MSENSLSEFVKNFSDLFSVPVPSGIEGVLVSLSLGSSLIRRFNSPSRYFFEVKECEEEFYLMPRRFYSYSRRLISARLDWVTMGQL